MPDDNTNNIQFNEQCSEDSHQWSRWCVSQSDPCVHNRVCTQCGQIESRIEHEWAPTNYRTEDVCMHFVCRNCGEQRTVGHRYQVLGSRAEGYICRACGRVKRRSVRVAC